MKILKNFCVLIVLIIFSCAPQVATKNQRPNIIYILADDLGFGDLSFYNKDSKIKTPNLDRLAASGMSFMDMHSTSSVCTPTRYSILTGEYAWRTGLKKGVLWSYGPPLIAPKKNTVAKMLKQKDYNTAVIGKWHLGLGWELKEPYESSQVDKNSFGLIRDYDEEIIDFSKQPNSGPLETGFDYSYIIPASLDIPPYVYLENNNYVKPLNQYTQGNSLDSDKDLAFWRPGPMAEGFEFYDVLPTFINKAKNYIDTQKEEAHPFFLYLPLPAPHTPWLPTVDYNESAEAGMYGDFVTMVDAQIGKLLDHLEEKQLIEQTLIVFTSDNGPYWKPRHIDLYQHKAAGNLRGMKGDVYDGGHRVPFIVKWENKIKGGRSSSNPNTLANLMATLADVTGADSSGIDSHSIYDELINEDHIPIVKPIIHHSSRGHFAIRKGEWKFIEKLGSGGFSRPTFVTPKKGMPSHRLFNMNDDPLEATELSKKHPELLLAMQSQLDSIVNAN